MKTTINKQEATDLLNKYLHTNYLRLHSKETEVIMRALAKRAGEDEEFWGLCGLLHDLDLDVINNDMTKHGKTTVELLKEENYNIPEMFQAILAHVEGVEGHNYKRVSDLDYILSGAENITGLISAYVILRPDKKIEGVKTKSVMKKFKSPAFAAKVNRNLIRDAAEHAGMELNDFIDLSIKAMATISDELGM